MMLRSARLFFILLSMMAIAGSVGRAESAPAEKLEPIFNGRDLSGWKSAAANPFWRVEQGVLIGESVPALTENYLWTEQDYVTLSSNLKCVGPERSTVEWN